MSPTEQQKTARKWALGCTGVVVAFIILIIVIVAVSAGGDSGTDTTSAEEKRKGFHCLSDWDGNHDELERLVRQRLNDPGSMETYETRIGTVQQGRHRIVMEFGAKNAFGGMVRSTATGWVDNESCEATLTGIE